MIIKLGHETVEVKTDDREEAIKEARRILCDRWPILWDMIMAKPDEEFI